MRILICHNYYKNRGGEDEVFDYEKELLKQNGYEVIEYSKRSRDINSIYKNLGILINSFFSVKTYREINKIIKDKKPDIAHIHNIFPIISPSIFIVLKRNNIPIVQTIHNYRFYCSNGLSMKGGEICNRCENLSFKSIFNICNKDKKLYDLLLSLIIYFMRKFKVSDKINYFIAPSMFIKNKLVKCGIDKNKVILKRNSIRANRESIGTEKLNSKYFTYIGRISEEKGIIGLIKAFKEIKDIELKVIGGGPLKRPIEEFIKKEKISNIKMIGFIVGEKKSTIISNSIANIIPSVCYENCPLVLIECLKEGVPVVANNIGALSEYIKDGYNGYIYDFNDLNSLEEIILRLYNMGDVELCKLRDNCKNSFYTIFDERENFMVIDDLYKLLWKKYAEERND